MATLLALSTLTTKQHFIADVLSGYALAFARRARFALRGLVVGPILGRAWRAGAGSCAARARRALIGALKSIRS